MSYKMFNTKEIIEFYNCVSMELKTKNRFINNKLDNIIEILVSESSFIKTYSAEQNENNFYRARKYTGSDKRDKYYNQESNKNQFKGYDEENSFVNLSENNKNPGRCNPEYIAYLYMASSEDCCIREINPSIGDIINVAQIQLIKDLKLLKIEYNVTTGYKTSTLIDGVDDGEVILDLPMFFSKNQENHWDYYISQYISEHIKNRGYDGIIYQSSQQGYTNEQCLKSLEYKNFVIFNYKKCKAINSKLYAIKNIQYFYD